MDEFKNKIISALPELTYQLPGFAEMNFTPLLASLVLFIALTTFFKAVLITSIRRLKTFSDRTNNDIDDAVINAFVGIRVWVLMLVSFYLSMQFFSLPPVVDKVFSAIVYAAVAWQVIEIILHFIRYLVLKFVRNLESTDGNVDPNAATAADMIILLSRIILWTFGLVFVLSNLGIEVTSLLAGLGIGGIAVAFALQGILSDLFASFSIYFDKPFRVGDFVVVGTDSGTVEKIGIKTTRIRTLQGEELVVSNAELTTARVQNFKKLQRRRIVMQFGVTYETEPEQLKAIPDYVAKIFTTIEAATLDRVHFFSFGDSALLFEVVYFIESNEYMDYMNCQQTFNYALVDKFAAEKIRFAYPTQTVHLKQI